MNNSLDGVAAWGADYHLLAAALLAAVMAVLAGMRQPARRMAAERSTLAALAVLAALCALPGWSLVHLWTATSERVELAARAPVLDSARSAVGPWEVGPTSLPAPAIVGVDSGGRAKPQADGMTVTWAMLVLTAYAGGSGIVGLWLVIGAVLAGRVRRSAAPAAGESVELLGRIVGTGRRPELLVSAAVDSPLALGLRRPAIVLPVSMVKSVVAWPGPRGGPAGGGPTDDLGAVLAHEWAHVANGDLWTLAASRWLLVLLWPQPLYWLLRRAIRLDQETLADAAAAETTGRVDYAGELLAWARRAPGARTPRLAGAVGLWEGPSQLKRRVALLLDERFTVVRACSRRWRLSCAALVGVAVIALSMVTLQPATRAAGEEESKPGSQGGAATGDAQETHHKVLGPGMVSAFRAGRPPTPPTFKKNALAIAVVDEGDKPVAGVEATLYRAVLQAGTHEVVKSGVTDGEGEFEFTDVVSGARIAEYEKLEAEKKFPPPSSGTIMVALKRPGLSTAIVVQQESEIALRGFRRVVKLRPAATLSGRVTDPEGKPVSGALAAAGSLAGTVAIEGVNQVTTDADGRYAFADRVAYDAQAALIQQEKAMSLMTKADRAAPDAAELEPLDTAKELLVSNLVVRHPEFAVTQVQGGDVPGVTDVQLAPPAAIAGRVVHFESGKPAVGVPVLAYGRPETKLERDGLILFKSLSGHHSATTKTDDEGRYRLRNLPEGKYDIWAQLPVHDWKDATWVCRGVGGVKAMAGGAATMAPDLVIGPGGVIRGQLVDAETGEPLQVGDDGPIVRPIYQIVGGPQMQHTMMQTAPCNPDGSFEMRTLPGESRVGVSVRLRRGDEYDPADYQSEDDFYRNAPVLDVGHGERVDVKFPVYSMERLTARRAAQSKGFELLSQGKLDEAIAAFNELLAEDPSKVSALMGRAQAREKIGQFAAALADYEKLLKLQPDEPVFMNNIADLLATSPGAEIRDGGRAVALAERAVALARKRGEGYEGLPLVLDTLASAYAEIGEFEKAVATEQEAIRLAPEKRRAEMQSHLDLYEKDRPFRRKALGTD